MVSTFKIGCFGPIWPNLIHLTYFVPSTCICTDSSCYFQKCTINQSLGYLHPKLAVYAQFGPNRATVDIWLFLANCYQFWPILALILSKFDFVTGVGSSNFIYVRTDSSDYFSKHIMSQGLSKLAVWARFCPNLAQFGPFDLFCHWYGLKTFGIC